MKVAWLVAALCVATAAANVVPVKGERKLADADFLKKQRLVLDLFVGLGHHVPSPEKDVYFDVVANSDKFSDPTIAKKFFEMSKVGFLGKDEILSLGCGKIRYQATLLFELMYFAKDFDTFYKVARCAREHINPVMFAYAYNRALMDREDTKRFYRPPAYEIFPNFFVPQDTMHEIYDFKMSGKKQGRWEFNNTGYEYNYHTGMYGGPLGLDLHNPHTEYKISYFREDVGLNHWYASINRYPKKYQNFVRSGEVFYYIHQQLFARYTLERLGNSLPFTEPFDYNKPIRVGYNPRITHVNGEALIARPDGFNFKYSLNKYGMSKAEVYEDRIVDAIDYGAVWNKTSDTLVSLLNDDGIDRLGDLVRGKEDHDLNGKYYGNWFSSLLEAIAYPSPNKNTVNMNGGATFSSLTALRDPVFYNALARFVGIFQKHKASLPVYTKKDLAFPGVTVSNFEVDKLLTFYEMRDFEVSNGVAVSDPKEYIDLIYTVSQFRLNHKPFTYKITLNSDGAYDAMVRLYIGPKYDSEEHLLSLNQKRLAMVELDLFPVKITAGQNVIERNSKESVFFAPDIEGFRSLYERIGHAEKTGEPFYVKDEVTCGFPENLMLPVGWKSGLPYTFTVVVTPYNPPAAGQEEKHVCGFKKLYDGKPLGFPFDRPIWEDQFDVPNIFFKDENIYHKEEFELNRSH